MTTMNLLTASIVVAFVLAAPPAGAGTRPITGIDHVGITVSDIDATIAFYSKAVPYHVASRYKVRGSSFDRRLLSRRHREVEIALVVTPTTMLQLMDFEPGEPAAPNVRPVIGPGYTHICFQSPATDSAYVKFRAAGLQMVSRGNAPIDIGGYGVRYAYGRDPDGIMIETEVLDKPKRSEAAWVTHIANVVNDRDALLAFYTKLLASAPYRTIEQENRPRLDEIANIDNLAIKGGWFSVGNLEIEVWEYTRPKTPPAEGSRKLDEIGYNAIGFAVPDLAKERLRLKQLGVRLVGRPMTMDGHQVQYAYDPFGNLFSVRQSEGAGSQDPRL